MLESRGISDDPYYFECNGARLATEQKLSDCGLVSADTTTGVPIISMTPAVVGRPVAATTVRVIVTHLATGNAVVVNVLPTDTAEVGHCAVHLALV